MSYPEILFDMNNYLSIDIGTTSTKAFIYSEAGLLASAQCETSLIVSDGAHSGYVEQDPEELFQSVLNSLAQLQIQSKNFNFPSTCGITNQRESIVAFNKSTGIPITNAISWMDVRTSALIEQLKNDPAYCVEFQSLTGLKASTFFSAFKIKWILENIPAANASGDLAFATIDSWILWRLTGGKSFYTDPSNASRTFLFDLNTGKWSEAILMYFGISETWLPEIKPFYSDYGSISEEFSFAGLKITALIGDQQSSLIGHWGKDFVGKSKCTFGTGAFLLKSLKNSADKTKADALKTIIIPGHFAEEFPIVCAGSLVKWLQSNLNFISSASDLDSIDFSPKTAEISAYFVPNLAGCLYPAWNPSARGSFHNISLQTDKSDLILSVLESIAFCIRRALESENVSVLSVDGGMCTNRQFCQLLANICNCSIRVLENADATGLGAAILASNFTLSIDHKQEIIAPQAELQIIYNSKYEFWSKLQQ